MSPTSSDGLTWASQIVLDVKQLSRTVLLLGLLARVLRCETTHQASSYLRAGIDMVLYEKIGHSVMYNVELVALVYWNRRDNAASMAA